MHVDGNEYGCARWTLALLNLAEITLSSAPSAISSNESPPVAMIHRVEWKFTSDNLPLPVRLVSEYANLDRFEKSINTEQRSVEVVEQFSGCLAPAPAAAADVTGGGQVNESAFARRPSSL